MIATYTLCSTAVEKVPFTCLSTIHRVVTECVMARPNLLLAMAYSCVQRYDIRAPTVKFERFTGRLLSEETAFSYYRQAWVFKARERGVGRPLLAPLGSILTVSYCHLMAASYWLTSVCEVTD